jgi:glycosyltransferase involved in cell wall biosynthesis
VQQPTGQLASREILERFTVVVPCFNEIGAVETTLRQLADVTAGLGAELVAVDDGSTDGTSEVLSRLEDDGSLNGLTVVYNEVNLGYGAAIKAGVRCASTDLIVIIDADGTYPCQRVPEMVEAARTADMVVGARTDDQSEQVLLRRIAKRALKAHCSWLVGRRIPDMNSGLRVFRRREFERFARVLPDGFSLTTTLTVAMMRSRLRVRFVPITYSARVGRSKIRPLADTLRFVQLIVRTGMYFAPLRVLVPLVVFLTLLFAGSLSYDVFVLQNLTDKTILLLLFAMNTLLFGLLADMIDKRG